MQPIKKSFTGAVDGLCSHITNTQLNQSEGFRQVFERLQSSMIVTQLDVVWAYINITPYQNNPITGRLIEYGINIKHRICYHQVNHQNQNQIIYH